MTIPYPRIPPELFRIGPIAVRWYGLMYLLAFIVGTRIARRRARRGLLPLDDHAIDGWVGYLVVGMIAGARLTYIFLYDPRHFAADPSDAIAIWHGGLSFHGAILGMALASVLFARRRDVPFWTLADTLALAGPPGLCFGRIGNFINGELYGRATTVPWAMVFPADRLHLPRHPSQLYEAAGEGVVLFLILRALERRSVGAGWYRPGLLGGGFLVGYGVIRFLIEFTRQPDAQLGFVIGSLSMGQLLSSLMIVLGAAILVVKHRSSSKMGA